MLYRSRRNAWIISLGLATVAFLLVAGCGSKTTGRSSLTTSVGDRKVQASLDGAGFISTQDNAAVITFGAGKIVVEKESVKLDGEEIAKAPADAKNVKVDYTAGKLTVTADDESIFSKELGK